MTIEIILSRLNKVKKVSKENKYTALCPSHDDRNPSLFICELPDRRIKIFCHAGCGGNQILESIGLSLKNLYPERLGEFKSEKKPFNSTDCLTLVGFESTIILACAGFMREGKELSEANFTRLVEAVSRIQNILRICGL